MYLVSIILAACSLPWFILPAKTMRESSAAVTLGCIMTCGSAAFGWYCYRYLIRADERGLTWRTPLKSDSCSWRDITDYYLLAARQNNSLYVIEVGDKYVVFSKGDWKNAETLAAIIQRRTAGRLGYDWEKRGTREREQFPIIFRYNPMNAKGFQWMGWIGSTAMCVVCTLAVIQNADDFRHSATQTEVIFRAVFLLFVGGAVVYLYAQFVRIGNDTKRRLDQILTVDAEGITLSTRTTNTFIRWREVTAYRKEPPLLILFRYVIESPHAEIRYTNHLGNSQTLRTVIERFVPPELCQLKATPKPNR